MHGGRSGKRGACNHQFTLVEMLVVIGIMLVLAGLLLPTLQEASQAAQAASCMNNLKQIGISANVYSNEANGWFVNAFNHPGVTYPNRPDELWHRKMLIMQYLVSPILSCPSDSLRNSFWYTTKRDTIVFSYGQSGYLGDLYVAYRPISPVPSCGAKRIASISAPAMRPVYFDLGNKLGEGSNIHVPICGVTETGSLADIHTRHGGGMPETYHNLESSVPGVAMQGIANVVYLDLHGEPLLAPFAISPYTIIDYLRLFLYKNQP